MCEVGRNDAATGIRQQHPHRFRDTLVVRHARRVDQVAVASGQRGPRDHHALNAGAVRRIEHLNAQRVAYAGEMSPGAPSVAPVVSDWRNGVISRRMRYSGRAVAENVTDAAGKPAMAATTLIGTVVFEEFCPSVQLTDAVPSAPVDTGFEEVNPSGLVAASVNTTEAPASGFPDASVT